MLNPCEKCPWKDHVCILGPLYMCKYDCYVFTIDDVVARLMPLNMLVHLKCIS
jgi:hypothetical protein